MGKSEHPLFMCACTHMCSLHKYVHVNVCFCAWMILVEITFNFMLFERFIFVLLFL